MIIDYFTFLKKNSSRQGFEKFFEKFSKGLYNKEHVTPFIRSSKLFKKHKITNDIKKVATEVTNAVIFELTSELNPLDLTKTATTAAPINGKKITKDNRYVIVAA